VTLAEDVLAVRSSVTLADGAHLTCVRVGGRHALDALDRISPRELFARPGQMVHTLLLDEAARPFADLYIACDEDDYLILAEGPSGAELVEHVRRHAIDLDIALEDLSATHALVSLNGPYAWELLAEVASPDVIGLPYLGFFHEGRFTCFRGGRTGEYGYDLLIARGELAGVRAALLEAGAPFDLREVGLDAIDLCSLENGFFNVHRDALPGLTPIELQLQWRVSYHRTYPGSAALAARRAVATQRSVMIASRDPIDDRGLPPGGSAAEGRRGSIDRELAVELAGERVGAIIQVGKSPVRDEWLALAVVDRDIAHPGIAFTIGGVHARSVSSPAINNRSAYVDPQRHSYATRERDTFPGLVRP
jgi:glycine cleavage system aminomethyltransferase T